MMCSRSGCPEHLPVEAGELRRCVDRVAAAAREEDLRVLERRTLGDRLGQLERGRRGGVAEDRPSLELLDLPRDGIGDLGAAVPDVAVPEACRAVEIAVAVLVVEPDALAAGDHQLVVAHHRHVGERMPEARVGSLGHAQ